MTITLKKLLLIGLLTAVTLVFSGCLLRSLFGFAVTSSIADFVDIVIEGETNIALCTEFFDPVNETTTVECQYRFADGEISDTSTARLLREFGILGVFLDPLILQVSEPSLNFSGTYDDGSGSGPQPLVITEMTSFFADVSTEVFPEPGHKFVVVDFPSTVPPTITSTNNVVGDPFSFTLNYTSDQTDLKAMYAGEVQANGETYYPPMYPCTTDFSTIPALTVPLASSLQDLEVDVLTAIFNGGVSPCNNQVYDYNTAAPPPEADLSIVKADAQNQVPVGDPVEYTVTVTNNGPDTAENVVMTDNLPAGVNFVSASPAQGSCSESSGVVTCDLGGIAFNTAVGIVIVITSDTSGDITNNADVTADTADPIPGNNSASEDTEIVPRGGPEADLEMTMTDSPDPVVVGDDVTYTVTLTNNGPDTATGVVVTNTLPLGATFVSAAPTQGVCAAPAGGLLVCILNDINDQASAGVDIVVTTISAGTISNHAILTTSTTDPVTANNSATEQTTVVLPEADLSIAKSDDVDPVVAGDNLTYTVTVNNAGPSVAENVVVTDTLPAGVTFISSSGCAEDPSGMPTCSLGSIPSGGSAQYTIQASVDAGTSGTITNQAAVTSTTADPDTTNNSASENTTVVQPTSASSPRELKLAAIDQLTPHIDERDAIGLAIKLIDDALGDWRWIDDFHLNPDGGNGTFRLERRAVLELQEMFEANAGNLSPELVDWTNMAIDDLVEADRILAETKLQEAKAGPVGPDIAEILDRAQRNYDAGLVEQAGGDPAMAIEHFWDAWILACRAIEAQD